MPRLHYVFASEAAAESAQAAIHAQACAWGHAGLPHPGSTRYADPVPHPSGDGRAEIPADAGGVPTEQYRTSGAVALPEPVVLDASWEPQA